MACARSAVDGKNCSVHCLHFLSAEANVSEVEDKSHLRLNCTVGSGKYPVSPFLSGIKRMGPVHSSVTLIESRMLGTGVVQLQFLCT